MRDRLGDRDPRPGVEARSFRSGAGGEDLPGSGCDRGGEDVRADPGAEGGYPMVTGDREDIADLLVL
jgi:hypothetical protein